MGNTHLLCCLLSLMNLRASFWGYHGEFVDKFITRLGRLSGDKRMATKAASCILVLQHIRAMTHELRDTNHAALVVFLSRRNC